MSNISKINGLQISAADAQYVAAGNVDGPLGYNSVESANTASYINPTFISASAAASGFGSGGGGAAATSSWAIQAQTASYSTTLGAEIINPAAGQLRLRNSIGGTISSINGFTASLATSASLALSVSGSQAPGGSQRVALLSGTDSVSAVYYDHNGITYDTDSNQLSIGSISAATSVTASSISFAGPGSIRPGLGGGGIEIEGNTRVFITASNSVSIGALNGVDFSQGGVRLNNSVAMTALTSVSMSHILTYNPTNGFVYYTASSAIGGGGGSTTSASFASTASYVNTLNQNVNIVGNLSVIGTASYTYVSSSTLDVGTNTISVNVAEPAQRFGGLIVYDSGSLSHQATASLLWDSLNNHWIYQNASGSTYSGGMLINGPRNTGALGDEQGTTSNALMKGQGGDHITSSGIFDDGTNVYANRNMQLTGSLTVTGNVNATASWASNAVTASYSTTLGASLFQPTNGWLQLKGSDGQVISNISSVSAINATSASLAQTASYISPTFISASAAASGFGSGGGGASGVTSITAGTGISVDQSTGAVTVSATGGGSGGTNLGLVYAVSLGYLMP